MWIKVFLNRRKTMALELVVVLTFFAVTVAGQNGYQNQQFGDNQPGDDCCQDYCYSADEEPYLNFATKTAYASLNNRRIGNQHIVPDCTPVQIWGLIRHGTRYPKDTYITVLKDFNRFHEEVIRNYEQRKSYPDRGRLCREDYDLVRRWRWNDTITESKGLSLSQQGIEEMKLLARRYMAKYSEILGRYDERSYYFQYPSIDRAHDSYQAFIEGLFGSDAYKVHANTMNDDKLTRPYDNCRVWTEKENLQMNNTNSEHNRFKQRQEYTKMVRDVFTRLGFRYSLNASIIDDIYHLCAYEKAWNVQQRSPWCSAFNKDQLKLLEYAMDLEKYYETGYGNPQSEKIGCAPVKDFFDRFEKTTTNGNTDGNKATFLFTHSSTILTTLTTLGIAKDYIPLTADNYYQQTRRNWRTSVIDPFAANLVAVLYQCRGDEKYKVMFFLNEVPIEFPECSVGLCNWSTVRQKYQNIANECNVEGFCSGQSAGATNYLDYLVISTTFILMMLIKF